MEVLVPRCAAIDIGRAEIAVCVRAPGQREGTRRTQVRKFTTMSRDLLAVRDWLAAEQVTTVGMESTGDYWKPVYYLLEDAFDVQLLNPQHVKNVPGRKTDVSDAVWLCQLVEHGLARPSFVPPEPIRRLRDLTRYRSALTAERTREANRLHNVLEDAGIKLGVVVSDILGVSGRQMIQALIEGQRDPEVLAEMAYGRMRSKLPALREALTGRFNDHHGLMCRLTLGRIDSINATIAELNHEIEVMLEPFRPKLDRLRTIPGVGARVAQVLIAETGGDMSRFPTPGHLASWAGVCPGNNESAGKHHSGRARPGNVWLKAALGEAATAARRTKNTYLAEKWRRIARRRGNKRATVAVARSILEASWHILTNDVDYADLGADHFTRRSTNPERKAHRLITELRALGYHITLPQAA